MVCQYRKLRGQKYEKKNLKSDIVLSARQQIKCFSAKKFPKGLAAPGQVCFQLTPGKKYPVWKDYCTLVHPHGPEWDVEYHNDNEILSVPHTELGLAIQPDQEVVFRGRLMKATHYADNKLHMIYVDLVSGEESEYEPEKKKKKSNENIRQIGEEASNEKDYVHKEKKTSC